MYTTLIVNGRKHYSHVLSNLRHVRKGVYTVERRGVVYTIAGGRNLGGSRRDWFMTGEGFIKHVACTSVMDALHVLETM